MLSTEMNWEVVQDFLNVSGIKGVALIDGQSRPYFKGIEKVLNSQQRDALAQGVWQVLETIPENFDSFEFQFAGTQVYIHKMTRGLILLVLTHDSLLYPDYCEAFTKLKSAFEADDAATLEAFRRLLGARNTTQITPIEDGEVAGDALAASGATSGTTADVASDVATGPEFPVSESPASDSVEQEIARSLAEQNGHGGAAFQAAPSTEAPVAAPDSHLSPAAEQRNIPSEKTPSESVPSATVDNPFAPDGRGAAAAASASVSKPASKPAPEPIPNPSLDDTLQELFQQPEPQPSAPQSAPAENPAAKTPFQSSPSPSAEPLPSLSAPPDPMREEDFVPAQSRRRSKNGQTHSEPAITEPAIAEPKRFEVEEGSVALPSPGEGSASSKIVDGEFGPDVRLMDWVEALNCLGHCATHYLGRAVVANYWRTSRPGSAWISTFEIERSAKIQPSPALPLEQSATVQQRAEMRDWAYRFSERCGRVIRDFPQLAETQGLSAEQRQLLEL